MFQLLIWGTGKLANSLTENGLNGKIIGYIETIKSSNLYRGLPVYEPEEMPDDYDYIIVANTYVNEIYDLCKSLNLDIDRVIFLRPVKKRVGFTNIEIIKDILEDRNYTNYCSVFGLLKDSFFEKDRVLYDQLNTRDSFQIREEYYSPKLNDKYAAAGSIGNDFWQDLWAAQRIYKNKPLKHFDIGSRIDGFIAHILAMNIPTTLIDIRKFPGEVDNLDTILDDATNLTQIENESIDSMSALCSLEHFGLGRYGDPIDPEACFKCFKNIQKKIKKGGWLYLSLPIGRERLAFNAHRIFYASTVVDCFSEMELIEFSCTKEGKIEYDVEIHKYDNDMQGYRYGLFMFRKK